MNDQNEGDKLRLAHRDAVEYHQAQQAEADDAKAGLRSATTAFQTWLTMHDYRQRGAGFVSGARAYFVTDHDTVESIAIKLPEQ